MPTRSSKFPRFAYALLLVTMATAGACSAPADSDVEEDDPATMSSATALSSFGKSLVGDYRTDAAYPRLSLDKSGGYSWDTGIRCVTTPCPSGDTGRFSLYTGSRGRRYVNLLSYDRHVSRWFLVAALDPAKLVGAFGTTGTFSMKSAQGGCTSTAECGGGEQCIASACTARPLCVQVNGADRFTAHDFAAGSFAEANAWGESTAAGSSWGISLATCAEVSANLACTGQYAPVCALTSAADAGKTFSNECEMRRAVIGATSGYDATAVFQSGACTTGSPRCSTYWLKSDPAAQYPGAYYVKTFGSAFDAKAWIDLQPSAVNGLVLDGACPALTACTKEYAPVCGGVRSDTPRTFGNRCAFEASVRSSSAAEGWSKGYVNAAGACAP